MARKSAPPAAVPAWRSRIVGHEEVPPDQLLDNPANWRQHPPAQAGAMTAVLDSVGWVQEVIVNRQTGVMVDGHLRVKLARERGEALVPVKYVDLSPEEERLVLAMLDPIAAMAETNADAFTALLEGLDANAQAVAALLDGIPGAPAPTGSEPSLAVFNYQEQYAVSVMCKDAADQERIYNELVGRGYDCRVVVV